MLFRQEKAGAVTARHAGDGGKGLLDDHGEAVAVDVAVAVAVAVDVAVAGVLALMVFSTVVSTVSSTVTVRGGGGRVASS